MEVCSGQKQYKRKWISAKRQLKKLVNEQPVLITNDYEDEASDSAPCTSSEPNIAVDYEECSESEVHDIDHKSDFILRDGDCSKLYSSSESDDYDSENDQSNDTDLCHSLMEWVTEYHVKNNAVDKLLKILQKAGHCVPATARSLLKTVKDVTVVETSGMQYVYLDISQSLTNFVNKLPENRKESLDHLEIALNIDGLPLFKSSSVSLWPILCSVVNVFPIKVFPIALAGGSNKPSDLDFLNDTVRDLKILLASGLTVGNDEYPVHLKYVVCDAPARAMVKSVKQYSGYAGCDKCNENGTWLGRMTFQKIGQLRTNDSFRTAEQPEHHTGKSPFCELPIDMIKTFPIDYMHQCCLGVMKRLIIAWMRGKKETKLSAGQICEISSALLKLRKSIPNVFARKPRSLLEIDRWKATELRLFLVYIGKLVLKNILRKELYDNFLIFSVAISILVSPALVSKHSAYAHNLLLCFVDQCRHLYGAEFLTYNMHSMTHLANEAVEHGSLDCCAAFRFESYLYQMKKMVRSGKSPVTQIVKRLSELKFDKAVDSTIDVVKCSVPNNVYITEKSDCCEIVNEIDATHGQETKLNQRYFLCRVFKRTQCLFEKPCDSRIIGTYAVLTRYSSLQVLRETELKTQAVKVEIEDSKACFMAVLHDI